MDSWAGILLGAAVQRPVHLIITTIKWIRTRRLSIKNSLSGQASFSELGYSGVQVWAGDVGDGETSDAAMAAALYHALILPGADGRSRRFRGWLVFKAHRLMFHFMAVVLYHALILPEADGRSRPVLNVRTTT